MKVNFWVNNSNFRLNDVYFLGVLTGSPLYLFAALVSDKKDAAAIPNAGLDGMNNFVNDYKQ
jgi:hypothetical protein